MCAAGGSERTLVLRTAREHQPLVFCLRRGLLRSRDLPSLPWGFSPLETTPHIQQAHPSTCPKCRQRWGSRSSLNLSVSLHRLSTASDGGGRWAVGGGGGGGRFPLLPCFSPIREPGTFPARSKSSHCRFKASSPSASATCLVRACSSRNEQEGEGVLHFSPPCVA